MCKQESSSDKYTKICARKELCTKETGYKGGRGLRETWWRQAADEQQLKFKLKYILVAAK